MARVCACAGTVLTASHTNTRTVECTQHTHTHGRGRYIHTHTRTLLLSTGHRHTRDRAAAQENRIAHSLDDHVTLDHSLAACASLPSTPLTPPHSPSLCLLTMPSLEITINVPLSADEQRTFLAKASKTVAEIVGKPEAVRPLSRSLAPSWPSKLTT